MFTKLPPSLSPSKLLITHVSSSSSPKSARMKPMEGGERDVGEEAG